MPITTEDLYGPSGNTNPTNPDQSDQFTNAKMETPPQSFIETPPQVPSQTYQPTPPKRKRFPIIILALLFVMLFGIGVWLSSLARGYIPTGGGEVVTTNTPTPTPASNDPYADWNTYTVMDTVSYKFPPDVLSPICDTTNCVSCGTYLPGGTRFTVAPRGTGYALPDFRGSAIADVNGLTFTTKDMVLLGRNVKEFVGTFAGRTVSGYAFAQMRGYMIPVSTSTSLEINHFVPSGITADFASDDVLFDKIVASLEFGSSLPTPQASPSAQ